MHACVTNETYRDVAVAGLLSRAENSFSQSFSLRFITPILILYKHVYAGTAGSRSDRQVYLDTAGTRSVLGKGILSCAGGELKKIQS